MNSLKELAYRSGESVQTLINWHKNNPRRFELILKGVVAEKAVKEFNKIGEL